MVLEMKSRLNIACGALDRPQIDHTSSADAWQSRIRLPVYVVNQCHVAIPVHQETDGSAGVAGPKFVLLNRMNECPIAS